jgi:CRISPR/Cas system-associated protein Csm6
MEGVGRWSRPRFLEVLIKGQRRMCMGKNREVKKEVKKQPQKSLKERRLEKKSKKTGKSVIDSQG